MPATTERRSQVNFRTTNRDRRDLATIRAHHGIKGNTAAVREAIHRMAETCRAERRAMNAE